MTTATIATQAVGAYDPSGPFNDQFAADPRCMLDFSPEFLDSIAPGQLDEIHLDIARRKFASALEGIPFIRQLASINKIERIDGFDDLVPLFYTHEAFKSYPQSWLENGEFGKLTKWLGKLCAADLGGVDASQCELIEDWMKALMEQSVIDVQISTSADGKAAFMPRSHDEWALLQRMNLKGLKWARNAKGEVTGLEPGVDRVPLVYLGARRGARSMARFLDLYEETYGEGLVDTLLENNDSDLLSLAGRIREASRKGEAVQIRPELLARKDDIARINADRPARMEALMERMLGDYKGKRIFCFGTMQLVYDLALRFREMGVTGAYSPDSLFMCGSGFANGVEPPNWKQEVVEILGIPDSAIRVGYSMQEALWSMNKCDHDRFHMPATIVPYVLDENDQAVAARGSADRALRLLRSPARNQLGRVRHRRPGDRDMGRALRLRSQERVP